MYLLYRRDTAISGVSALKAASSMAARTATAWAPGPI